MQSHDAHELTVDECCPIPLAKALMIQTDTVHEHITGSPSKSHCSDPDSEDRASENSDFTPFRSDELLNCFTLDLDPMMMTSDEIAPMMSADPKVTLAQSHPRQMQHLCDIWSLRRHSLL